MTLRFSPRRGSATVSLNAMVRGPAGPIGNTGITGPAGTIAVGTVTGLSAGAPPTIVNVGTPTAATLNFGIPAGQTGSTGSAATIAVGTVTTLAAGASATVVNAGSSSAATFNFGIPQGIAGTLAASGTPTVSQFGVWTNATTQKGVSITGLVKGNGASDPTAAVAGTDYLAPAAIGVSVQAYDADLTTWAGLTPSANAQSLVTAANYAAMRTLLALTVGTDVQAYDAQLSSLVRQNSQSAAYTLVAADAGKHIYHPSSDGANARAYTIPANSSVAFAIGTVVTFINMASGAVTIPITTDTLRWSPAGTTGTRTLAQYGVATAVKHTSTEWVISGSGLS